jgi:molecular chaperone DnaK
MGTIIGIDLGTTNSVCAFMDRGDPKVIINEEGGRVTPSVVGFSADGERFVGDIAKRQLLINPDATVHSIKRFVGRRFSELGGDRTLVQYDLVEGRNGDCAVSVNGRNWSPQELSAMIMQKLKKSAEDFLGESVTEAVVTVPAYFTDRQRQATRDAGTIAGLDVLRIINEPTAAALAYVHDKRAASTIAVFDFGGGTFDISLLEVDRDIAEVRATRGNNTLGGADIDKIVVGWLLEQFQRANDMDVSNDRIVMQRLRDAAERAKLELSHAQSTDVHLPFLVADASGPKHLQATLSRSSFEDLIRPLVARTVVECERALKEARLDAKDVDEIIMVGGSSRIPLVQEMVKDLFGRPLNKGFNPDEVVAVGAAIQAGILEGDVKSVTLLDVTNFSLGIEVAGGRFATLIPKNSTIPAQKTQLVSTVVDNQRTVKIHVLQGESPRARDNVSLGEFELTNIQPAAKGVPRIRVRFSIDANGIVHVSAQDMRTGKSQEVTIDAPTGLSREDVAEMAAEAASATEENQEAREVRQLRSEIEQKLVGLEGFLRDSQALLHKSDLAGVEAALKRGRMALLKSSDRSNLGELSTYLSRFHGHLNEKVRR